MVLSLLNFRPGYRVAADGADITAVIRERAGRISVTDEDGVESDMLEVSIADHSPLRRIALPRTGAEIEAWLGYEPMLEYMGLYIVDEIEMLGPPDEMVIRARAAAHEETEGGKSDLQTQKTRSWDEGTTLGEMADTIASEHGLEPSVSEALEGKVLPHVDQLQESDINLITRVAGWYDGIAKPAAGRLVVVKHGEGKSSSGEDLPTVTLRPGDVSNWSVNLSRRDPAGSVIAVWRDLDEASDVEVTVGEGEPVRRLRETYPDEATAKDAARAEHERTRRMGGNLTLQLPGRTDLMAEGYLQLAGFREGVDRDWLVTRVSHVIDSGGYRCTIEAELPEGD